MRPINRKGQVQTIAPAIIALIIAGIFLVLGLIITQELRDTDVVSQANSLNITNETIASVSEVGTRVARATEPGYNSHAVVNTVYATNTSINLTVPSTNYTVSDSGLYQYSGASDADAAAYNNSDWLVSYTGLYGDEAWTSTNNTIAGLGTFGDFWEIIVLAIVTTVVMALLLVTFGRRRRR